MNNAKSRVELELKELSEKLSKIYEYKNSTCAKNLTAKAQLLIADQTEVMTEYAEILKQRLGIWQD